MGGSTKNLGAIAGTALGGPMGGLAGSAGSGLAGKSGLSTALPQGGLLGQVGAMAGAGGGAGGTGFETPKIGNIQSGTTAADVNKAEKAVGNNMAAQQALLQALQGQNGLGAQSQVFNQQQSLANQLNAANGVGTQNAAIAGLQNTAGMYGNIAQGIGPNPAQAMLNQQTNANIANQAALMASQRGAGANAGLLARQAAMQGGNLQQNAVGQAATMQANQQLNALSGLANTQQAFGNMGGAQVGQLQAQQAQQAGMANQMAGQQIAQTNQNTQAALSNQQMQQNALAGINTANVSGQSGVNAANAGMANTRMGQQGQVLGGAMQGIGAAAGMAMAEGGMVPDYSNQATQSPMSDFTALANNTPSQAPTIAPQMPIAPPKDDKGSGAQGLAMKAIAAGVVPVAEGGQLHKTGGEVEVENPSQKAVASGDSYANDKIPAKLSEGEIVLPRSVTMSEDPISAAAEFVRGTLSKERKTNHLAEGGRPQKDEVLLAEAPIQDLPQGASPTPQAPVGNPSITNPAQAAPSQPQAQPMPNAAQQQPAVDPDEEDLVKYNTDLASGAITPKTYGDLYGKKDTLGKIGTIFGLLVSGAGSGLTGQPNALLDMMNKEIERDFAAQKATKESARNFLSLEAERRAKDAAIQGQKIQNVGAGLQGLQKAGEVGAGLDFILKSSPEARKLIDNYSQQINGIMTEGAAIAKAKVTAGHNMMQMAQKTGNPQTIAAAQQVQQAANESAAQGLKDSKAKASLIQAKKDQEINKVQAMMAPVNEQKYNSAIFAKLVDPGVAGQEKAAIEQNRKDYYQFMDTFEKLASMPRAGEAPGSGKAISGIMGIFDKIGGGSGKASNDLSEMAQNAFERERNIQIEGLYSAMGGRMSKEEIANLLPSIFDSKKSMSDAMKKVYEKFKNSSAELAPNLKRFGLVNKFPDLKNSLKKEENQLDAELKGQAEQAKKGKKK